MFQNYLLESLLLIMLVRSTCTLENGKYICNNCHCHGLQSCSADATEMPLQSETPVPFSMFTSGEYFDPPDCSRTDLPDCSYHPIHVQDLPCNHDWRCCADDNNGLSCQHQNLTNANGTCNGVSPCCYQYVACDCTSSSIPATSLKRRGYGVAIGSAVGISCILIIGISLVCACKYHNKIQGCTKSRSSTDSDGDYASVDDISPSPSRPKYPSEYHQKSRAVIQDKSTRANIEDGVDN